MKKSLVKNIKLKDFTPISSEEKKCTFKPLILESSVSREV